MKLHPIEKKSLPIERFSSPLAPAVYQKFLKKRKGWEVVDGKKIEKLFVFKNFVKALEFLQKIGKIAEEEKHHPDMFLFSYKNVKITLSTHSIGGLSENDFTVASKIDAL